MSVRNAETEEVHFLRYNGGLDIPDESGLLYIMEAQLLHTGGYSCHEH
jgi:hypothetical protein